MKIKVEHKPAFRFTAVNESGNKVQMDASPGIGGENTGMRPMEMLIAGLGGCSGIDVVSILQKKKQGFETFSIEIDADRDPDHVPSLFTKIHVSFFFTGGQLNPDKVKQAVDLSIQKYCSVARTLEKTAVITYDIYSNGNILES